MKFSQWERSVASMLSGLPAVRSTLRTIYRRINFTLYGTRGFRYALHPAAKMLPVRVASTGNGEFFGYFDKTPWSRNMRWYLTHSLDTSNKVGILAYDLVAHTVKPVGQSLAFTLQQGAMAQWHPTLPDTVVFNDYESGSLISRIASLSDESLRIVDWPIQVLHPLGQKALTLNYSRLARVGSTYGYSLPATQFSEDLPLNEDGIWELDLQENTARLLISLEELIDRSPRDEMRRSEHKVNHLLYSPSGVRFVFVHRWISPLGKFSRLYLYDSSTEHITLLLDNQVVSHYCWLDNDNLLAWAASKELGLRYQVINVTTGAVSAFGDSLFGAYGDGHPSSSPNGRWVITDSYPDKAQVQHLLMHDRQSGTTVEIGSFLSPLKFSGANRCDLHPRWSPDGKVVSIDSSHDGHRSTFLIDVSEVLYE